MTFGSHVQIVRFPDGTIKSPSGQWTRFNHDLYYDGLRYLYIAPLSPSDDCPLTVSHITSGALTADHGSSALISIPSLNLQFSLDSAKEPFLCPHRGRSYEIERTQGGYLVSLDTGVQKWRDAIKETESAPSRSKRSLMLDATTLRFRDFTSGVSRRKRAIDFWEFSSYLRTSESYAQLRYEQRRFVVDQMNKNLGLLQKVICESMFTRWIALAPPDLPRKVAQYLSGSYNNIAEAVFGNFKITSTAPSISSFELELPLNITMGMYKVKEVSSRTVLWAEPVTGNLFKEPFWTHYWWHLGCRGPMGVE